MNKIHIEYIENFNLLYLGVFHSYCLLCVQQYIFLTQTTVYTCKNVKDLTCLIIFCFITDQQNFNNDKGYYFCREIIFVGTDAYFLLFIIIITTIFILFFSPVSCWWQSNCYSNMLAKFWTRIVEKSGRSKSESGKGILYFQRLKSYKVYQMFSN